MILISAVAALTVFSIFVATAVRADPFAKWIGRPADPTGWGGIRPQVAPFDADTFLFVDMYFVTHAMYNATSNVITEASVIGNSIAHRSGYTLTYFPALRVVVAFGGDDGMSRCGDQSTALLIFKPSSALCASTNTCLGPSSWTSVGIAAGTPTPSCRMDHAAAVYGESRLYIHGGRPADLIWAADFESKSDLWVVDIMPAVLGGSVVWRQLPSSRASMYRHFMVLLPTDDTFMYIAGGYLKGTEVCQSVQYFSPALGAEQQSHNSSFWSTLKFTAASNLPPHVVGIIPLPHRLVYVGTTQGSGVAKVLDLGVQRLLDGSWSLGALVSVAFGINAVGSNLTAVFFDTSDLARLPQVLLISLAQASCDSAANQIESEFGDYCTTCPSGSVADGHITCTPCSSPFLTLAPAREMQCGAASVGHLPYEVAVAAPVVAVLVLMIILRKYLAYVGRRHHPVSRDLFGSGVELAILGFAVDNDVALWHRAPEEMSRFTSAVFAEVRRITGRHNCLEVHNTGDHGILVAQATTTNIFDAALELQDAALRLAEGFVVDLEGVTVRILLHSGACDSRYNASGSIVVSGKGIITVFDILARLPSNTLCVTHEYFQGSARELPTTTFASAKSLPSIDSSLGVSGSQQIGDSSFSSRSRFNALFKNYVVDDITENTTRRFHKLKVYALKRIESRKTSPSASSATCSSSRGSHNTNNGGGRSLAEAGVPDPPEISISHYLESANTIHPLVSSGLLSADQFGVLVRMTQRLYGALIHGPSSTNVNTDEAEFLFGAVADSLRVQRHRGLHVNSAEIEDHRTRDAAFRLLEIIDMLQTKDVIASLTHTT